MGNYSKGLSKRAAHTKIREGYCLICGDFGRLTKDHVPPKGAITITKIEQKHISEVLGAEKSKINGVRSPNGSKFKTICAKCNNHHIGGNDFEVARVCKSLTQKIKDYSQYADNPYNLIHTDVDAIKYARAMIGHLLSATTVDHCKLEPVETPFFTPLQKFVLGDDTALDETHDIYYWFYPHNRHLSMKIGAFFNEGHHSIIGILSFFPVAFMVTVKNEGTFPPLARKLSLTSDRLTLDLSYSGQEFAEFPFVGLKGNQMYGINDAMAIISYPIGQ